MDSYDTVFVGSPNWWSTIAPPIATFLSQNDLSGKTIVPFCTHGGGLGKVAKDIEKLCPHTTILGSFEIYGDGGETAQAKMSVWLGKLEIPIITDNERKSFLRKSHSHFSCLLC